MKRGAAVRECSQMKRGAAVRECSDSLGGGEGVQEGERSIAREMTCDTKFQS